MTDTTKLQQLKAERERWVTRIFWLGLEIAAIFAIPAALGAWIGTKLGGGTTRTMILAGTFVLSWVLVIIRFRMMTKKLKALDAEMKALQADDRGDN